MYMYVYIYIYILYIYIYIYTYIHRQRRDAPGARRLRAPAHGRRRPPIRSFASHTYKQTYRIIIKNYYYHYCYYYYHYAYLHRYIQRILTYRALVFTVLFVTAVRFFCWIMCADYVGSMCADHDTIHKFPRRDSKPKRRLQETRAITNIKRLHVS